MAAETATSQFEQALSCISRKEYDEAVGLLTEVLTFRCFPCTFVGDFVRCDRIASSDAPDMARRASNVHRHSTITGWRSRTRRGWRQRWLAPSADCCPHLAIVLLESGSCRVQRRVCRQRDRQVARRQRATAETLWATKTKWVPVLHTVTAPSGRGGAGRAAVRALLHAHRTGRSRTAKSAAR